MRIRFRRPSSRSGGCGPAKMSRRRLPFRCHKNLPRARRHHRPRRRPETAPMGRAGGRSAQSQNRSPRCLIRIAPLGCSPARVRPWHSWAPPSMSANRPGKPWSGAAPQTHGGSRSTPPLSGWRNWSLPPAGRRMRRRGVAGCRSRLPGRCLKLRVTRSTLPAGPCSIWHLSWP